MMNYVKQNSSLCQFIEPTTKTIKQASLISSAFEVAAYGVKLPIIDRCAANPRNSAS